MRKGFTLIELLIGSTVSIVVVGTILFFFSYIYQLILDHVSSMEGNVSTFWVAEIINSDLRKVGYRISNYTEYPPVDWKPEQKKLIIRYVDYEMPGCNSTYRTFEKNDICSYIVTYYLKDGNLKRSRDCGANNTVDKGFPMFDKEIIEEIYDFSATIDNNTHIVKYIIKGRIKGRESSNFTIEDAIICRNWHY